MTAHSLADLGYRECFRTALRNLDAPDLSPARVAVENKHNFVLLSEKGYCFAEVPGAFLHHAASASELPKVGDWVAVEWPAPHVRGVIRHVLPRFSKFSRKTGGKRKEEQVIASNIDRLMIVQGLDRDFNVARLERTIIMAFEHGAAPVILLNRADMVDDAETKRGQVLELPYDLPLFVTSCKTGLGLEKLAASVTPGITVAFVGSSGTGKSSIINALAGDDVQEVGEELGSDERGKHTTVRRELVFLDNGGMVIDTPGIREVQLTDVSRGLSAAFPEMEELAGQCRFSDCVHDTEPDCAVKAAVESGALSPRRLEHFLKLSVELCDRAEDGNKWARTGQKAKRIKELRRERYEH